jgi:AhpD family alkylhydroperoxidase
MSQDQDWAALLKHVEDSMPRYEDLDAESFGVFMNGLEVNEAMTILDPKTRELIALAVGAAIHCDGCIAFHVHGAKKAGATKAEVMAAMSTAMTIGSGSKFIQSIYVLDAYDQIEVVDDEEEVSAAE